MEFPTIDNNRILVVDDDAFNRDGVTLYLRSHGYETLEAGDEATAIAAAEEGRPRSAVVDIVIPPHPRAKAQNNQSVGLRLVRQLKTLDPVMGIVIFSAYEDRGSEVWDLARDGMRGIAYLFKGIRPDRLRQALQDVEAGRVLLDGISPSGRPRLAGEMLGRLSAEERPWVERAIALIPTLTEREQDVALRLAASQNNLGIGQALGLAEKTVEAHVGRVYAKLGLSKVVESATSLRRSILLAKAFMIDELMRDERGA